MKVTVDLCLIPIGVGVSLSRYIAQCEKVLREAGLNHELHAYGTNIEGEWQEVMEAVRLCHERVHTLGAPRISSTIKLGTRIDREQNLQDKVDSVKRQLDI